MVTGTPLGALDPPTVSSKMPSWRTLRTTPTQDVSAVVTRTLRTNPDRNERHLERGIWRRLPAHRTTMDPTRRPSGSPASSWAPMREFSKLPNPRTIRWMRSFRLASASVGPLETRRGGTFLPTPRLFVPPGGHCDGVARRQVADNRVMLDVGHRRGVVGPPSRQVHQGGLVGVDAARLVPASAICRQEGLAIGGHVVVDGVPVTGELGRHLLDGAPVEFWRVAHSAPAFRKQFAAAKGATPSRATPPRSQPQTFTWW